MIAAANERTLVRRPPLWLAAAAVASGWAALYSVTSWILLWVVNGPVHEDMRMTYVAAEAGLRYGWSTIYDETLLRSLSASFPGEASHIDPLYTYVNPPLMAWVIAPLTAFPEPVAYAVWSAVSAAALMLAWRLAAPYAGLEKATLLLAAIGMWPVLLAFYFGQPIIVVVALLALAWWLCNKQQPLAAGAALALATFLKPQDVILVPAVLLVSGRYRAVGGWMVGCLALGVATILTLGSSGLTSWAQALQSGEAVQSHFEYTLAYFFGLGPLTFILWTVQAVGALFIARLRRSEAETVFAVGILGSAAIAFHFHEADYSILILAAWLFLRTSPPLWHRLWLLIGILPMQNLVILGPAASQPQAIASHAPQLIWDALWLAILLATTLAGPRLRARFAGAP